MSTSAAILWLGPTSYPTAGGYTFGPVPQVGQRDEFTRAGESKMAPTNKRRVVTLHGHFTGANLNAIQTKVASLRAALSKEGQVLYFYDGTTVRISNELVTVDNIDIPVQWGQYHTDYTITLSYYPLDDVHKALGLVSYGNFVFCADNSSQPTPIIGREIKVERQSPDAAMESARVILTISGFFEEGSLSGNQTKIAALIAELEADRTGSGPGIGTLTYPGLMGATNTQTVKVVGFNQHEDSLQRRIGYSVQFQYVDSVIANGVVKLSSMRRVSRVTQRYVAHLVPFIDYASVQLLGRGPQKISATGYVICNTFANAQIAADIEIAAQFPVVSTPPELVAVYGSTYQGVEDPNSNVTPYASQCRVDWSVERFFGVPALVGGGLPTAMGGLYGTGLR